MSSAETSLEVRKDAGDLMTLHSPLMLGVISNFVTKIIQKKAPKVEKLNVQLDDISFASSPSDTTISINGRITVPTSELPKILLALGLNNE